MSGFDLVPVDGRDPIHLPPGETVLGRGPLLDIGDTRVSRHHGLLENLQGQLRLKPTHVNPCFIQSSLSEDPRPLEKDSWFQLHPGDLISLLPGRFIYRVEAVDRVTQTPRNSQNFQEEEEEEGLPVSADPDVGQEQDDTSPSAAHNKTDSQEILTRPVEESQSSVVPSEPRRRVLPAWMKTAATAVKRCKQPAASSDTQATPTSLSEEAGLSEERRPRKKRKTNKEGKQETDDPPASRSEVSRKPIASSQTSDGGEPDRKWSDGGEPDRKWSEQRVRTPCPYGTDCYRKNPLHFQEFCHPGDWDHQEDQDRPECPYGTSCYRKNPLHRKQFTHTQEAASWTQTNNPDEDEDEDEDSVDSDYVPPDSEDSGQEVFLKKRK